MGTDPPARTGNRFDLLADPDPSTTPKNKRKKFSTNITHEIFPLLPKTNTPNIIPKFIVINSSDPNKKLSDFSVFWLKKAIDAISTEIESINILKDGNLLILAKSIKVAEKFIKTKNLAGICPVNCALHNSLNLCKGIIYDKNLINTPEDEILEYLQPQGVKHVYKFTKFNNNKRIPSGLILLTFDLYKPPTSIEIAWYKVQVREYFPTPMRCRNCQLLGHTMKFCKNNTTCVNCNLPPHEPVNCTRELCANCLGEHPASSPSCPRFIQNKEILKIKTTNKCSAAEARRLYKQANPITANQLISSYAKTLQTNNNSINKTNDNTNSSLLTSDSSLTITRSKEQSPHTLASLSHTSPTQNSYLAKNTNQLNNDSLSLHTKTTSLEHNTDHLHIDNSSPLDSMTTRYTNSSSNNSLSSSTITPNLSKNSTVSTEQQKLHNDINTLQ